ncbi:MAG TPA: serine hydrolase [Ignavibacteria bacterium]|nr:serine hydrolase [Ignavibacteria bacterium]
MKKYSHILCTLLLISVFQNSFSQYNQDSLQTKINRIVRSYVDTNKAALVIGVIRKDGTDLFSKRYTYGHVRHDTASPRPDSLTVFHIGSVTKSYTATILSMLIQQGGPLNLNDFVEDHIPLNIVRAPVFVTTSGDTIKMRILDLATHFSALPDDPITPVNDSTSYQMMYHYLNNHRLSREPGHCFLYSNLGISFLGVVVTHTLGSIIDSLIIEKICDPLNMPDTRITLNSEQENRRATGYAVNGDSVGYFKDSWPAFYAAGGLYTTIKDFTKYLEFNMGLSNAGMQNVLDSAHKIRRVSNDTCFEPNATGRVGLVWQMQILDAQKNPGFYYTWKNGGVPGFTSFIGFADDSTKDLKTGIVMISNQSTPCDRMAVEILRYLNEDNSTGIIQTSQNIPGSSSLYQNYPNPFNPRTVINYQLTASRSETVSSLVNLKVYDVSGKIVATLVNEKQNAGSYAVEFNGEGFPSGIYFYKLETTDFVETKRMVLLK